MIGAKDIFRRNFILTGAGAIFALAQDKKKEDVQVAGATQDPTPRVGIVLSSFKEGEDHDGTKIPGLSDPQPPGAELTPAQFDAVVRKAIDLAALRYSEYFETVDPEDWVVILTRSGADYRIVGNAISYLAEHKRGLRFTVIDRLPQPGVWGQDYRKLISDLGAKFREMRFELVDLNSAPTIDLPVPGRRAASCSIPKIVQQCDRVISIAPLSTDPVRGVSLSLGNYAALSSKPVATDEALLDLFSYRPADLALVGGCWGVEGDGTPVHHNVLISGMKSVAVDSVAASVMGFKSADLPFLALGQKRGFGSWDTDEIWTRGNEIEKARRDFKKPTGWRGA
jgi:uncharacterized protein (DUF362 family)